MNRHYAFVNGDVHTTSSWYDLLRLPEGTVTYSTTDVIDPWTIFVSDKGNWEHLDYEKVPSEFKVHLLLMGVPM